MKKLDLGQIITILANVGVIAGIIFLAFELNQNNQFLAEQARSAALQNQTSFPEMVGANPEVTRLLYPHTADLELTELEQLQRRNLVIAMLRRFEWEYQRSVLGLVERAPDEAFLARFREHQIHAEWAEVKDRFSPQFVVWMDEKLSSEH